MSEKRFSVIEPNFDDEFIKDNENGEQYNMCGACEIMNEQQSIIDKQTEQHKARLDELIKENSELRMKILEQQATITKQEETIDFMNVIIKDLLGYINHLRESTEKVKLIDGKIVMQIGDEKE